MAILDIILLVILAYFALKGFKDGFILSVINVLLLLISLFLAVLYVNEFSNFLSSYLYLLGDSTVDIIAFSVLFLIIFIAFSFVANILKIVNKIPLVGFLNKVLGALFGLIKGILILSILVFLFNMYRPKDLFEKELQNSNVYSYLAEIAPSVYNTVVSLIPIGQSFYEEFNENVKNEIDDRINESEKDSTKQQQRI